VKIIHLSDLHGEEAAIKRLVAHVLARPDLASLAIAITGDITDDSKPSEWRAVQTALAPLVGLVPIWAVPGNHDCGHVGITFDPERAERARRACDMISATPIVTSPSGLRVWRWGTWRIIGLDSQAGNAGEMLPPLARGEIGTKQLAALEVELGDPAPTVVLLHHHPRWDEPLHVLEDAGELTRLITRRPQVRAALFGHQHKEALWGKEGGASRLWISAGKSTEERGGRLRYRTLDLETLRLEVCSVP
jgi:3',5'-cyclic AMP phosphodiesterase CpdA